MAQIKPGVLQSAARTANITGVVTSSNGTPVGGADVMLKGQTNLSTRSDARGAFAFTSVPWGTYSLVVVSVLGTATQNSIVINKDAALTVQYEAQGTLHTIAHVVAGGAGAHINVTSSSVVSVSPSQYAFGGNSTWQNLFSQIPGVTSSGAQTAGVGAAQVFAYSPIQPQVLTINGALSYETATMLDGMPLTGLGEGSGFDVSTLPMSGFETADVVRGPGANAPSIVDSIGGTFVLHSPGQVTSNAFVISASNDPYGGAFWNARAAWHFGKLSATFAYGSDVSPGPLGSTTMMPYPFTFGINSPVAIDGEPFQQPPATFFPNRGAAGCYCYVTTTMIAQLPALSGWQRHDGMGDLTYDLNPSISAEIFYAGSTSLSQFDTVVPLISTNFAPAAGVGYSGNITPSPAGEFNYPLFQGGFQPGFFTHIATSLVEEKVTASIGNGVLRLAALQNNSFEWQEGSFTYPSGLYRVWGTADVGPSAPGTPTAYNGTLDELTFPSGINNDYDWTNNRDLLASYAVQLGSASSVGVSYTSSYFNAPYNEQVFYDGFTLCNLSQSTAVSETTNETRLHFTTDLSAKLSLGLSWYLAQGMYHLPVPGSTSAWINKDFPYNSPRFGAAWQASPDIAVRAAVGGGYALPALADLEGTPLECGGGLGPECSQVSPAPNLKPETSFSFDLGTDVRVERSTVLSFDLYRTNLFGAYYSFLSLVPPSDCGSPCGAYPLYLTQFSNLTQSRMEGLNLEAHRSVPKGIYWTGNLGFTRAYVVNVPPGFYNDPALGCTNCVNQGIIPGLNYSTAVGDLGTIPYATGYGQVGYRWKPSTFVDVAATYYGKNNAYYTPHAFVELDAHTGYAINDHVSLLLNFVNLTGVYDQSFELSGPSYIVPVVAGAPPNVRVPNLVPYGPRAVILTAVINGP